MKSFHFSYSINDNSNTAPHYATMPTCTHALSLDKYKHAHPLTETLARLKWKGLSRTRCSNELFVQNSRENTVCRVIWHEPIMLCPLLGISSYLTILLSFSLRFVYFCHLIALASFCVCFVDCASVCLCSCFGGYVQYSICQFMDMRLHVRMSVFSHRSALLSLNQDMLWAADDADDSVMWECHQSLGTVTGFCLSASDAQTVAFSAHFTISAASFFLFFSHHFSCLTCNFKFFICRLN